MKNTLSKWDLIAWSGWVVVIFLILLLARCHSKPAPAPAPAVQSTSQKTVERVVYIHDTITRRIIVYRDHIIRGNTVYVPILGHIDTTALVKNFYAKSVYKAQIIDSILSGTIIDTISQNELICQEFKYKLLRPQVVESITTTTTTNTVCKPAPEGPKFGFYIGFQASLNSRLLAGVGPEILLTAPNKIAYGVGYELLTQSFSIKVYRKL